ncbi:MAG TPA: CARDB domain-containing protein, partial [Candidatus Thermoplasmatota archaeon]|nr:CARDB domain-containing protein [Candidatus Thermoplasmatota archaeon]
MVDVKKSQRKQVNTNRKKLYILSIIVILISNVFPLMSIVEASIQDPHLIIDSIPTVTEQVHSNNYIETTTTVTPWWNTNWHYRRIYNITGIGNISLPMNFTSVLRSFQVVNKTFDNSTITIVRYYKNGTIVVVDKTWFNESTVFHNRTNAVGTLSWSVSGTSPYGVYFDVKENRGTRNPMNETRNLTQSGPVHATLISTQGWWPEFINDIPTYYVNNTILNVEVYTTALAKNLTAHFLCNGIIVSNTSLSTLDNLTWKTTKKLSKIGDWTIHIIGYDDAGYQTAPLTAGFYIGKPDLIASNLTVPICYVGYNVTVTAHIRAVNTTVENVTVALRVNNINVSIKENLKIQKNENRTLQLYWTPSSKGSHNVSFNIFYHPDSNPSNNIIWKNVNVEGVPDLAVLNITVAPTPVDEGNPVMVTAYIRNTGDGNATNYEVVLYCEQNQNNHTMLYLQEKNSTNFSLKKNTSTNVTLTWFQTRYGKANFNGEWAVGIKILNTTQTPDKHEANNNKSLYHVLKVIAAERNPPILSNLEYLSSIELGNQLLIRVKATDASGIDMVVISIKTPNKTTVNTTMATEENDRYEYIFTAVQLGRHNFTIKATDLSPNKNQSIITGYFIVTEDQTPPTITYFGVNPLVQLPNHPVETRCITSDYSGIRSVEVAIRFPDNQVETHEMSTPPTDTKYVYTKTYETKGK